MNSAHHLIIVARTRLVPTEIFARGHWVVVEMTDDRTAIDRKFQALQRLSQLYENGGKPPVEVVVFASEKSDIGKVSVVGLHNTAAAPRLANVFVTDKGIRYTFWQKIAARLGEEFDPPVLHYDALEAERLFVSAAAKPRTAPRKPYWARIEFLGTAFAALMLIGFSGAWFLENMASDPATAVSTEQVAAEDEEPPRRVTKSERLSSLATYFSDQNQ